MMKIEQTAEALHAELSALGVPLVTIGFKAEPARLFVHTKMQSALIPRRYKGVVVQVVVAERAKLAALK